MKKRYVRGDRCREDQEEGNRGCKRKWECITESSVVKSKRDSEIKTEAGGRVNISLVLWFES